MRINIINKIALFLIVLITAMSAVLFVSVRQIITNELSFIIKKLHTEHVLGHALNETTPQDWRDPYSPTAQEKFKLVTQELFYLPNVLRVKLWNPEFEVVFVDEGAKGLIGKRFPENKVVEEVLLTGEAEFEKESMEEFTAKPEHAYDLGLGELLETYTPIQFPGEAKAVGVVEIYQGTAIFDILFQEVNRLFILILSGVAAIIFFLSIFVFVHFIYRPLALLTNASRKITEGNYDFEVKPLAKDEFGDLIERFDLMRQAMKEKIGREEEQRQKLELMNVDLENSRKALLNTFEDLEAEQKQVRQEKSKFETVLTNINDAVILTNMDGTIIAANKMFEKVFNAPTKDILNQPFDTFVELMKNSFGQPAQAGRPAAANPSVKNIGGANQPPENFADKENKGAPEALEKWFRKAFSSYAILEKELTLNRPLIEYGIIAGPAKPIFKLFTTPAWSTTMTMMGRIWVFSDISSQKELERARTEFISLTSHQLRTPSSGIKAFLELVLGGDAGPLTETQKDYLNEIYRSNERMIELIEALLNVSKIESGRLTLEPRPVDLIKLSEEVIGEIMPLISERKQKFEFIKPGELPQAAVDGKLVYQVISNLLTNASKYNSEGGSVVLKISKEANEILFEVSDTGWGIPERQHDKVFTKFFRGDNAVLKGTVGSGLGLYIVNQIVEKSGGRVWFKSEEDKGTTFYFTLPITR